MEPQVINGKAAVGTPLHRLEQALAGGQAGGQPGTVTVFAGDVADVCRSFPDAAKMPAELAKKLDVPPGTKITMKVTDVAGLVNKALRPERPEPEPQAKAGE